MSPQELPPGPARDLRPRGNGVTQSHHGASLASLSEGSIRFHGISKLAVPYGGCLILSTAESPGCWPSALLVLEECAFFGGHFKVLARL